MRFIPPMLATRLANPVRLTDPRYVVEPKLDGQRAQLHVEGGRTVACYSRPGLDLLRHPGLAWLRPIAWPFQAAVLDGEACAGNAHQGVQHVLVERQRPDGATALLLFDLLTLDGRNVMREPWMDRRKRLEDLVAGDRPRRVGLVPVTEDAIQLWQTWVGELGGEGIVLKERHSAYRPGVRSPAWLKVKPKLTLEVTVTGGSAERIAWGDWGEAVNLEVRYRHPRDARQIEIRQAVRVPRGQPFALRVGDRAGLVCWGIMPSGMLRHPLFLRWL